MEEVRNIISRNYYSWKEELSSLESEESEFQKWLFVHIASVLFGGKAGELLNLTSEHSDSSINRQREIIERLSLKWKFSYHFLVQDSRSAKVIIYNNNKVHDAISRVPPCIFNDQLNYPIGISPGEFLETVKERWKKTREIPHEIGLALGYPIKDVLGYMGLLPLKCMGLCGWRIYGDPAPSLNECRKFTHARKCALIFLAA